MKELVLPVPKMVSATYVVPVPTPMGTAEARQKASTAVETRLTGPLRTLTAEWLAKGVVKVGVEAAGPLPSGLLDKELFGTPEQRVFLARARAFVRFSATQRASLIGMRGPVARCSVALGPRHGPRSLPTYRKIAGSTRNPSRINCSTRCRLPPVAAVRTRWERRAFGFIELERAGDGVQDFVCYSGGLASFQAGVVLDADPGEHRHFLMAQALDPALAPLAEVRETRLPGADPRSP